jgi:hypothetical protein
VIRSDLAKGLNPIAKALFSIIKLFFGSAEKGAETSIYLAASPDVEAISGKYFSKKKDTTANPESYDEAQAKQLWKICEDLTASALPNLVPSSN